MEHINKPKSKIIALRTSRHRTVMLVLFGYSFPINNMVGLNKVWGSTEVCFQRDHLVVI